MTLIVLLSVMLDLKLRYYCSFVSLPVVQSLDYAVMVPLVMLCLVIRAWIANLLLTEHRELWTVARGSWNLVVFMYVIETLCLCLYLIHIFRPLIIIDSHFQPDFNTTY